MRRRGASRRPPEAAGVPPIGPACSPSAIPARSASSTGPGRSSARTGSGSAPPWPASIGRTDPPIDPFVTPPAGSYPEPGQRFRGPVTMRTSFAVADMTIHRIVEQEYGFTPIFEFLPTLTRECFEENRSWLEPAGVDPQTGNVVLCFQSYVVRTPHHNILVDACIAALKAAVLGVEDIDFAICTHLHGGHVGWNTRLENGRWVPTFPKARYLFSKKEYEYWTSGNVPAMFSLDPINESVLPVVEANRAELVTSDHQLDDHVRLLPTPGHTPDHFAVCLGRGGDLAVVTGDLIHSPIQARYPELVMRVDYDPRQAAATRRHFLERYCDTATLCCTMHFPSPSVGYIRRWGDGFRLEELTA